MTVSTARHKKPKIIVDNIIRNQMVFGAGRFLNSLRQKTQPKLTRGSTGEPIKWRYSEALF
jgi:hypothetical protein